MKNPPYSYSLDVQNTCIIKFFYLAHTLEFFIQDGKLKALVIGLSSGISSTFPGSYAMGELVRNLPSRQQRSAKNLEEDTVVAVLNTIHEIITDSSENARSLIQTQGIQKLVAISKSRWVTIESKMYKTHCRLESSTMQSSFLLSKAILTFQKCS